MEGNSWQIRVTDQNANTLSGFYVDASAGT
jgi:hypothetical protein